MKKIPFYTDQTNADVLKNNIEKALPVLKSIVDQFKAVGVNITDIDQIKALLTESRKRIPGAVEQFVFESLYPDTPAGFSREAFRAMCQMPDLSAVFGAIEQLNAYFAAPYFADRVYFHCYTIQGNVEINPVAVDREMAAFCSFVETEDEKHRLEILTRICGNLDVLFALVPDENPNKLNIPNLTTFNQAICKFELSGSWFVKHGSVFTGSLPGGKQYDSMKSFPSHPGTNKREPQGGIKI